MNRGNPAGALPLCQGATGAAQVEKLLFPLHTAFDAFMNNYVNRDFASSGNRKGGIPMCIFGNKGEPGRREKRKGFFKGLLFFILFFSALFSTFAGTAAFADVIIDNGDAGTSYTGTWGISGGGTPYGINSLWGQNGDTYTWNPGSLPAGNYEVFMWWTTADNRGPNTEVRINHNGGTATLNINQRLNYGQWNSLGTYYFDSAGSVVLIATSEMRTSTRMYSSCADAVQFKYVPDVNQVPTATIDGISPNPAEPGATVSFSGHGEDADGTIEAYSWDSSIDGHLSDSASFSTSALTEGIHTISFSVKDDKGAWSSAASQLLSIGTLPPPDVIIDNGDAGTSYTGTWGISGGGTPYGINSLWGQNGDTYTWNPGSLPAGNYEVFMWWTTADNRGPNTEVRINHNGGTATLNINQRLNYGQWNSLGTYYFDSAGSVVLIATSEMRTSTRMYSSCADAVQFKYVPDVNQVPTATIDGISPNPAEPGATVSFSGHGEDADGTIEAYSWDSSIDGHLSDSASFSTSALTEGTHTISFSVKDDKGAWSSAASQSLVITVGNLPPTATIDSISPNPAEPGATVSFSGHGEDADGTIEAYSWDSSLAGHLSDSASFSTSALTEGTHTISFSVKDDKGAWSSAASQSLVITVGNLPPTATIDSISPNPAEPGATVSFSGHGEDADGTIEAYSWDSSLAGHLSDSASFSTSALSEGTHTISFSVKDDKGVWSSAASQSLVITAGNLPPTATIDSIAPNPCPSGAYVFFSGHGTDSDGTIAAYRWESSLDGLLSDQASFNTYTLTPGAHTITFTVTDDDETPSAPVTQTLDIIESSDDPEIISDNGDPGTSSTGTWMVSSGANPYGSNSLYANTVGPTYTWTLTPSTAGDYEVYLWWTEYSNRVTSVPVTIQHGAGTATVYVNQRLNGGKWNLLGQYAFEAGVGYSVSVSSTSSSYTTCADAVKFVKATQSEVPPTADFSADKTEGGTPLTVQFSDASTGTVTGWLWDFGDGTTSELQNPSHQYVNEGSYTVSLTATNAYGSDTMTRSSYIRAYSATENIYCVSIYGGISDYAEIVGQSLSRYGATKVNGVWTYTNTAKGITYFLRNVNTKEQFNAAVREEGATILIRGHSNYGLGFVFLPVSTSTFSNLRYVDDDLMFNISSNMVDVTTAGLRYSQAYPNWTPIYKDGTDAIWPYDWNDPAGRTPPYNYYLTYTLPGDPTHYRVETSSGGQYIQRFPGGGPAWYSPDGSPPDPVLNPEYFIVNSNPEYSHAEYTGNWYIQKNSTSYGFRGYTYSYVPNPPTNDTFTWTLAFYAPNSPPGYYEFYVTYDPDPANATNVRYTISQGSWSETVYVNQEEPADTPAGEYTTTSLGKYYVAEEGAVKITTTGNANGVVIADYVSAAYRTAPVQSEFNADVRSGSAPLTVTFTDLSYFSGTAPEFTWDFGDGTDGSYEQHPVHTYASPGVYTVTLTVADENGEDTETKESLIVVDSTAPLHAEFTATSRRSTTTYFIDQSSGDVTGWLWDFGDGTTSTAQNPSHRYTARGEFTVTLTVSGPDGTSQEIEENFKYRSASVGIDNQDEWRSHFEESRYGNKTILDATHIKDINPEEFKYKMIFINTCFSGKYFIDNFNRGRMFYTNNNSQNGAETGFVKRYVVDGQTDQQLLTYLNSVHPGLYEYYDFNQLPPSMR